MPNYSFISLFLFFAMALIGHTHLFPFFIMLLSLLREWENNKRPKVVSVGCVGLWKHNGFLSECGKIRETRKMCHVMSIDKYVTCMGWFNVLVPEFIVACVAGYYFSSIHIPFLLPPYPLPLSTPATQAKFIVVSGRKDWVDLFWSIAM